jgi:putative hemolysin
VKLLIENIWPILLMLVLLASTAFFSAAETAMLNLSRRQLAAISRSRHRIDHLITSLHQQPREMLAGLLLAGMIVTTAYFSLAGIITFQASQAYGAIWASVIAAGAFAILVVCGEMLPKSVAYINSEFVARAAALPCYFAIRILAPIRIILTAVFVDPVIRLLIGPREAFKTISTNQFRILIEASRQRGLISADENQLLGEVLEFGSLKVRQAMRPRVDIIACDVHASSKSVREQMSRAGFSKLPVYSGTIDNIIGVIQLRRLLLHPEEPPAKLLDRVLVVPEQKTVESLIEFFRANKTNFAVVVDEYGGIAGTISLTDVVEEIVGPIEPVSDIEPVRQMGPLTYRLAGNLAIHDWAAAFGIEPGESRLSTIGGLVTAILGRIPKPGDTARLGNLKFTVELVRRNRIESLVLTLEPIEMLSGEDAT